MHIKKICKILAGAATKMQKMVTQILRKFNLRHTQISFLTKIWFECAAHLAQILVKNEICVRMCANIIFVVTCWDGGCSSPWCVGGC